MQKRGGGGSGGGGRGQIACGALGLCLSQEKPSLTYAAVCGRMGNYNGFDPKSTPAYCCALYDSGEWALLVNSVRSGVGGNVTTPGGGGFSPKEPHRLAINLAGDNIQCAIGGVTLGTLVDSTYRVGNAAVGSGWHAVSFDNFVVSVPF